jgi:GrpB-like predicted nucleotidyltransferase (UPF0157 family)
VSPTLRLVPWDPAWQVRFAEENVRVRGALGDLIAAVEHVGSTAVPGLAGKPVLDLAIAVDDEPSADRCIQPLAKLGYEYRGQHGDDPRRRYYVRNAEGRRLTQIHLYILPAAGWDEKLAFRDALRADADLAARYQAEKLRVADAVGWDKTAYSVSKGAFIEQVLAALRARTVPLSRLS